PAMANDTAGSIAAAPEFFQRIDRPNIYIKIPGTSAGAPAIEETIAAGVNVNVTLLFSLKNYKAIHEAYIRGLAAVANAKLAYQQFLGITGSDRWRALAEKGANVQRPLWASTGTKNPAYSDVLYVEELIGPDCVNTMP